MYLDMPGTQSLCSSSLHTLAWLFSVFTINTYNQSTSSRVLFLFFYLQHVLKYPSKLIWPVPKLAVITSCHDVSCWTLFHQVLMDQVTRALFISLRKLCPSFPPAAIPLNHGDFQHGGREMGRWWQQWWWWWWCWGKGSFRGDSHNSSLLSSFFCCALRLKAQNRTSLESIGSGLQ